MKEMTYEDYVEFFDKFDFNSLETLNFLVPCVNKDEERAFIYVYNKKFDEEREEFEGENDYDAIARRLNFNVEKVKNSIDTNKFNKRELSYFKNLLNNIPEKEEIHYNNDDEEEIDLTYDELVNMFNKYSLPELDVMSAILNYVQEYDMTDVNQSINDVYNKKEKIYYNTVRDYIYEIDKFNIFKVNEILSERELNFLYKLVENSSFFLSTVRDYRDEYENTIEDFNIEEYPIDLSNKFLDSLSEEIESRKFSIKKK